MKNLSNCPAWPALFDLETAFLYLGGKETRLFALVALGYLVPFSTGRRNTEFIREDVDAALAAARMAGADLECPAGINSVERAVAFWKSQKTAASAGSEARKGRFVNSPR